MILNIRILIHKLRFKFWHRLMMWTKGFYVRAMIDLDIANKAKSRKEKH